MSLVEATARPTSRRSPRLPVDETDASTEIERLIHRLLELLGEDPHREREDARG